MNRAGVSLKGNIAWLRRSWLFAVTLVLAVSSITAVLYAQPSQAGRVEDVTTRFSQVSTGSTSACALNLTGVVYCWGDGSSGQLGNGSTANSTTPTAVNTAGALAGKTVANVSVGASTVCALDTAGKAYCWGANYYGQIGDNSTTQRNSPVAVVGTGVLSGKVLTAISVGGNHVCALDTAGKAYCWGQGGSGQLGRNSTANSSVPVAVTATGVLSGKALSSISAGTSHTCALDTAGKAYCWGDNSNGVLGDNSTTQRNAPVAVNTSSVLSGKVLTAISAGVIQTCAVDTAGQAYCWGSGWSGQLGNGSTTQRNVPAAVVVTGALNGKTLTSISAGYSVTCAVDTAGQAYCWGSGTNGALGSGSTAATSVPTGVNTSGVLSGKTITRVSVGKNYNTCALDTAGALYCWGSGGSGELGNGVVENSLLAVTVGAPSFEQAAEFSQTAYRLYESSSSSTAPGAPLAAENTVATLDTTGESFRLRTGVRSLPKFTQVVSGGYHTCALDAAGAAYCWGSNNTGQLGNNATVASPTPVAVDASGALNGKKLVRISTAGEHTCALDAAGAAYCWGNNNFGKLGNGSSNNSATPVAVDMTGALSGRSLVSISAAEGHTCALDTEGKAYCWGNGSNGRLGAGVVSDSSVPVAVDTSGVLNGKRLVALSMEAAHVCAFDSLGAAYCWGSNSSGQLGTGASNVSSNVPVAVDTSGVLNGKRITSVAVGNDFSCATDVDGAAYCWGSGSAGRLGNGSTTASSVPVVVSDFGGETASLVVAGAGHACVLSEDSSVYCWGSGTSGRLGNDSNNNSSTPVAVDVSHDLSGKTVASLSAGSLHSCVLDTDGVAYCWGANFTGQLGDGSTANRGTPTLVPVLNIIPGVPIPANYNTYRLEYAAKSATTCQAQTTGFEAVTASTPIAYDSTGVANDTTISTTADDPTPAAPVSVNNPQTLRSAAGTFTNTDNPAGNTALYDFALKDNDAMPNTSYCMRIAYGDGTALERYDTYNVPEVKTTSILSLDFVDAGGATIAAPSFAFDPLTIKMTQQTTNPLAFSSSAQKLRLTDGTDAGYNVSIAATNGAGATWSSGLAGYAYNNTAALGRLDVDPSTAALTGSAAAGGSAPICAARVGQVSKGSSASFSGATPITLMSKTAGASNHCYIDMTGITMQQTVPAAQTDGSYSLDMTVTVLAQ